MSLVQVSGSQVNKLSRLLSLSLSLAADNSYVCDDIYTLTYDTDK